MILKDYDDLSFEAYLRLDAMNVQYTFFLQYSAGNRVKVIMIKAINGGYFSSLRMKFDSFCLKISCTVVIDQLLMRYGEMCDTGDIE